MNSKVNNGHAPAAAPNISDSRRKYFDRRIPLHRAISNFQFPRSRWFVVVLLPLVFTLLAWPALRLLAMLWQHLFEFWLAKLNMTGSIAVGLYGPVWLGIEMPYLNVAAAAPTAEVWWGLLFICGVAVAASFFISTRYLPLRYFLRVGAAVQALSLLFFILSPGAISYSLHRYLIQFESNAMSLMIIMPWIHGFIYYVFGFSLIKKMLFTAISLLVCGLTIPFVTMLHAYLTYEYSLMLLPLLYFMFGILLLIVQCIAIYGWAMSWEHS